jgi:hypothetical protein
MLLGVMNWTEPTNVERLRIIVVMRLRVRVCADFTWQALNSTATNGRLKLTTGVQFYWTARCVVSL